MNARRVFGALVALVVLSACAAPPPVPAGKPLEPLREGFPAFVAEGDPDGWRVEDGVLLVPASGTGWLRTREAFADVAVSFEFCLERGANGGLFLRAPAGAGDPAFAGLEIQLVDDHHWTDAGAPPLEPWQRCASLYAALPAPQPSGLLPPGRWNRIEALLRGARLAVALNGRLLYETDLEALAPVHGPPFAARAPEGHVGFQRYGAPGVAATHAMRIRELRIIPLR